MDSASVRLDTFVQDLEALRVALDLDPVHVIAHSWGALIAMKYAIAHPNRVRSLVLLDPMPPSTELWQAEQAALAAGLTPEDTARSGALRATGAFAAREPEAVEAVLRHSFRSQFRDPALAGTLDFHIEADYAERSRQFSFLFPDLLAFDLRGGLSRVRTPALVLYGEDEPGSGPGGDAIGSAIPDVTRVTIDDAGHFPFIERPEAFLDAVRRFLEAVSRRPR